MGFSSNFVVSITSRLAHKVGRRKTEYAIIIERMMQQCIVKFDKIKYNLMSLLTGNLILMPHFLTQKNT